MSEVRVKKTWVYLIVAILIAGLFFGWWSFNLPGVSKKTYVAPDGTEFDNYYDYYNYYVQHWGTPPPDEQPPPSPSRDAAKIQLSVHNAITDASISSSTTKVDITKVKNGEVDFLTKEETIDVSSGTTSALYYAQGDTLILHVLSDVDPTGGTDYYDAWYYVTLIEGSPLYKLSPSCLTVTQTSPTYKYTLNVNAGESTGYTVAYTAGTTPYWDIGVVKLYPRVSAANLDSYFKHEGTTLAKVTDGSSWVDTDGEITANGTMTTTNEDLVIELRAGATDVCYGLPMYTLSQTGQLVERRAVIIVSTSMTSIGTQDIYDEGWKMIDKPDLTAELAFYKVLDPMIPLRGDKFAESITFPVDASAAAASTKYLFKVWILDFQVPSYVETGSTSTSIPTAYGFISEFGLDSIIYARALTVSSGAGDNEVLRAYLTTPS